MLEFRISLCEFNSEGIVLQKKNHSKLDVSQSRFADLLKSSKKKKKKKNNNKTNENCLSDLENICSFFVCVSECVQIVLFSYPISSFRAETE